MAVFDPGTSTLKSTTWEAAAIEIAQLMQNAESEAAETPNNIALNYFTGDNVATLTATLPITVGEGVGGIVEITATNYLPLAGFTIGDSPDLDAATGAGAMLEIFQKLRLLEAAQVDAPTNVTITYDTVALIATITATTLPIAFSVAADGSTKIEAVPYLD